MAHSGYILQAGVRGKLVFPRVAEQPVGTNQGIYPLLAGKISPSSAEQSKDVLAPTVVASAGSVWPGGAQKLVSCDDRHPSDFARSRQAASAAFSIRRLEGSRWRLWLMEIEWRLGTRRVEISSVDVFYSFVV